MSIFKDLFQQVLTEKFGSGFTFNEFYAANADAVNYDIEYQGNTGLVSISGIEELQHSGASMKGLMRAKLDEQFP